MMDIQVIEAVTPFTISKEDMRLAVQDFQGSTTFIKSLVPLTAINIIKHRIDYDEETFDNHTINGEEYVTVKALVSKDNPMYKLHMNLRSAMKLVNDKHLVTLYACIKCIATEEVVEHYRFNIKYLEDNNKEHSKTEFEIAENASKMLSNINHLKHQVKLKAEDVYLELQLTLNDGYPKFYVKQHFKIANHDIEENKEGYIFFGSINTSYHKLKILGKSTLYENITSTPPTTKFNKAVESNILDDTEDIVNKELRSDTLQEIKDVESNKSRSFREGSLRKSEKLDCDLDNCVDSISINCPCKIVHYFKDVPLLRCQTCQAHSHLPCLGFKSVSAISQPFLCIKCSKKVGQEYIDNRLERSRREEEFIALVQARLMVYFVLYCKGNVNDVIKQLPKSDVDYFIDRMSYMNILDLNNNEYTVDMNLLEKKASIQFFHREYKKKVKKIKVDKMVKKRKNLETEENKSKKAKTFTSIQL